MVKDAPIILGLSARLEQRRSLAQQIEQQGAPCRLLPEALPQDGWGAAWDGWTRFLEEQAPCSFLLLDHWESNAVIARLSNRIKVIAYVEDFHPEIARLGHFCDALTTLDRALRFQIAYRLPHLAPRLLVLATGSGWARDLVQLHHQLGTRARWRRQRTWLQPSLRQLQEKPHRDWATELELLNRNPFWPEPCPGPAPRSGSHQPPTAPYKVILAIGGGQISGVDIFASHLVRGLRARGQDARVLGERALANRQELPLAQDIPVDSLGLPPDSCWQSRCQAALDYLESQAPCVYIPNYEFEQASMIPKLSDRVKVLAIGHSDDPSHYEQLIRLGPYCDGIVAISRAVAEHLAGLDSGLTERTRIIPYGVELQESSPPRPGGALRILYAGRFVAYQKRVADLLLIARSLKSKGVPFQLSLIGQGELGGWLEYEISRSGLAREVQLLGKMANRRLLQEMSEYQVLLLPSAFEGLPVVLLEAMAQGLVPVISRIRSGVPELIVENYNGLLAAIGNVDEFADQLSLLHQNPDLWLRLSQAARKTVREGPYSQDKMVDSYQNLMDRLWRQSFRRPTGSWRPPPELGDYKRNRILTSLLQKVRDWSQEWG